MDDVALGGFGVRFSELISSCASRNCTARAKVKKASITLALSSNWLRSVWLMKSTSKLSLARLPKLHTVHTRPSHHRALRPVAPSQRRAKCSPPDLDCDKSLSLPDLDDPRLCHKCWSWQSKTRRGRGYHLSLHGQS